MRLFRTTLGIALLIVLLLASVLVASRSALAVYFAGFTSFSGQGWIRPVYFTILVSHTILAATVPPLALILLYRAFQAQFGKHRRLARWTLPVWFYVSVTGVVVYLMLYQLSPSR